MDDTGKIFVELEHINGQLARIISDQESEKEGRKMRNTEIDRRLGVLEADKIRRDTTIKNIVWLCGFVGLVNIAAIIMVTVKFFSK